MAIYVNDVIYMAELKYKRDLMIITGKLWQSSLNCSSSPVNY